MEGGGGELRLSLSFESLHFSGRPAVVAATGERQPCVQAVAVVSLCAPVRTRTSDKLLGTGPAVAVAIRTRLNAIKSLSNSLVDTYTHQAELIQEAFQVCKR
jgi:hypothetical protein